jgi:hypothetical protein
MEAWKFRAYVPPIMQIVFQIRPAEPFRNAWRSGRFSVLLSNLMRWSYRHAKSFA